MAYFPVTHRAIEKLYKGQLKFMWFADEIIFASERDMWMTIRKDPSKKHFVMYAEEIMGLFAQLDGLVNKNIGENFESDCIKLGKEYGRFLSIQKTIENVHNEAYGLSIQNLIPGEENQQRVIDAAYNVPHVASIVRFAEKYMDASTQPFYIRATAFMCIEAIIFASAFAGVFFLRDNKILLNTLGKINEFVFRDETIHAIFGNCLVQTELKRLAVDAPTESKMMHNIATTMREAVDVSKNFAKCSLEHTGMNAILSVDDMYSYIEALADRFYAPLNKSSFDPAPKVLFGTKNKLGFMQQMFNLHKNNFFESTTTDYVQDYSEDTKTPIAYDVAWPSPDDSHWRNASSFIDSLTTQSP